MHEDIIENYTEWANDELIWGKGLYNWTKAYSLEEWAKAPLFKYEELEHPLCRFGL